MDKVTLFFDTMRESCIAYEKAKELRLKEKDVLIISNDWKGVAAWNAREEQYPFPYSRGETTALRAWTSSVRNNTGIYEVTDLPWKEDVSDFVKTIRKAGITEIVVTDHSTALMDGLHALAGENIHIVSTYTLKHINRNRITEVKGILLRLE